MGCIEMIVYTFWMYEIFCGHEIDKMMGVVSIFSVIVCCNQSTEVNESFSLGCSEYLLDEFVLK